MPNNDTRNTHALINRLLPVEIICKILLDLAQHYFHQYSEGLRRLIAARPFFYRFVDDGNPLKLPSPYAWIRIINVCHYWRSAALVFPRLWALISDKHPECLNVFLQRSGEVPLILGPHHNDHVHKDSILTTLIHGERARLRVIELNISVPSGSPLWRNPSDFASLEGIHLHHPYSPSRTWKSAQQPSITLPRLCEVTLVAAPLPLLRDITRRTPVRKLVLRRTLPTVPTPAAWIKLLTRFPSLEELELDHVFPPGGGFPFGDRAALPDRTMFPRMRALSIVENEGFEEAVCFLYHIAAPPSTRVSFEKKLLDWSRDYASYTQAMDALATTFFDGGLAEDILSCRVLGGDGRRITIDAFSTELSMRELERDDPPETPLLSFKWETDIVATVREIIKAFIDRFALFRLRTLHVAGDVTSIIWQERRFTKIPELRELHLEYITLLPDIPIASNEDDERRHSSGIEIPFPKLEVLRLSSAKWHWHPPWHPKSSSNDVFDDIHGMLRRRKDAGAPLRALYIATCWNVEQEEIRKLQRDGLVETLEWDSEEEWDECWSCAEDDEGFPGEEPHW